jgi:hypothetical protein
MKEPIILRGRPISSDDLTLIQSLIKEHSKKGRKFISQELCHKWQRFQPNGNLPAAAGGLKRIAQFIIKVTLAVRKQAQTF